MKSLRLQNSATSDHLLLRQTTESALPGTFTKPSLHLYVTVNFSGKLCWSPTLCMALGSSGGKLQSPREGNKRKEKQN